MPKEKDSLNLAINGEEPYFRKVILVMGINNIAADLESAIARVKHYTAPVNAARIGIDTPCWVWNGHLRRLLAT